MSISSDITRIKGAKDDLKTAINAKGGTLTTELIDEYPAAVDAISTGTDTSSATATASDILTGKTAYISDGTEATGTCDFNADTTDATATADSLLYGHTAYGADGTKLTGTGAYWQKVMCLYGTFQGSNITGDIEIYAPSAVLYREIFLNCTGLTGIKLTYSGSMGSTASSIFKGCISLVTIDCELNCTSVTSLASAFQYCAALQTVRFTASSVGTNFSFANSPLLTTTTLLSIANGIGAAITLTLHATSKTNCDNILVDNVGGVAVLGSAMSLSAFITNIKGATIA
jgi:hypothetical protein